MYAFGIAFLMPLVFALVPSFMPTWRGTFIAAGVMYGLIMAAFLLSLREIGIGAGAALSGLFSSFGTATAVLVSSCFIKAAIAFVLSHLRPVVALWLRRILVCICLSVSVVSAYAVLNFNVDRRMFTVLVSIFFLWLFLMILMLPSNPVRQVGALRLARPDQDGV